MHTHNLHYLVCTFFVQLLICFMHCDGNLGIFDTTIYKVKVYHSSALYYHILSYTNIFWIFHFVYIVYKFTFSSPVTLFTVSPHLLWPYHNFILHFTYGKYHKTTVNWSYRRSCQNLDNITTCCYTGLDIHRNCNLVCVAFDVRIGEMWLLNRKFRILDLN